MQGYSTSTYDVPQYTLIHLVYGMCTCRKRRENFPPHCLKWDWPNSINQLSSIKCQTPLHWRDTIGLVTKTGPDTGSWGPLYSFSKLRRKFTETWRIFNSFWYFYSFVQPDALNCFGYAHSGRIELLYWEGPSSQAEALIVQKIWENS